MHVLLLEDDPDQSELYYRALSKSRYEVLPCANLEEATKILDNFRICVAVVDIELASGSGFELIEQIHARCKWTKVVVNTVHSSFDMAKQSIAMGVVAFVEKSAGLRQLIASVDQAANAYLRDSLGQANRELRFQIGMLDSLQEGVLATDSRSKIIYANHKVQSLLLRAEAAILGETPLHFFRLLEHENRSLAELLPSLDQPSSQPFRLDTEVRLSDNLFTDNNASNKLLESVFRLTISEMRESPNVVDGYVWVLSDITEQRASEMQLEAMRQLASHTQRLNTVGQMAGVLSHELNQPHSAISNYVSGLMMAIRAGSISRDETLDVLQKVHELAYRASAIVSSLRSYTTKSTTSSATVQLDALIGDAIRLLQPALKLHKVRVHVRCSSSHVNVCGDELQLSQVFVNIIKNAIDSLTNVDVEQRNIFVHIGEIDDDAVVCIADSGPQIAPEQLTRFLEPYFTTKGDGLGLGLSLSLNIIQQHSGSISIMQNSPSGVAVEVRLPLIG